MSAHLQFDLALMASPVYLGTIVATTTKNNHDTNTPFNNTGDALKGKLLMLQSDADCHIAFGTTNAITAATTATTGSVKLLADERVQVKMGASHGWIACVGTANLKVWELPQV